MSKSKWPDFLFTITVRFVCGIVLGGLACFLFSWRGLLRAFSQNSTYAPFIWLGLCGLIGGVVAVFTIPRWQTPWYRRDSEALALRAELASLSHDRAKPGPSVVKKSVTIKTVGEDGQQQGAS